MRRQVRRGSSKTSSRRAPDLSDDLRAQAARSLRLDTRETVLADSLFEDATLEVTSVVGKLRIEDCILRNVAFPDSKIPSLRFSDVRLVNCDLANVEVRELSAVRVEFVDCRMTGFRVTEACACQDVLISGGTQRYSVFAVARFRSCEFNNCDFEEAYFQEADLRGCIFHGCNLKNADMVGAQLKDADLRGSNVDGLRVDPRDLGGVLVDPSQALMFARLLGIRIG